MPRRYYSSTAGRTTLASGVTDSATSFSVVAVSGWPSSFPYTLIIDQDTVNEEIVQVTARSGTSLTVVRAVDGTTGVAHSAGAAVNHGVSARDFDEPNAHIESTSNPHSVTAAQAGALALAGGTVTGPTVVDVNSSTAALKITQIGSGPALLVEDSASPDSSPFVVTESGNVGVGTTSPVGKVHASIEGSGNNVIVDSAATSPVVIFRRSAGTLAAPTVAVNADAMGALSFRGYGGSAFHAGAQIAAEVDGTPGTNDMPGRLVFSTTADGASTPTERMRITSAGNVGIGTTAPTTRLEVVGRSQFASGADAYAIAVSWNTTRMANGGFYRIGATDSDTPDLALSNYNGTERLRITNSGNVGIGTSGPSARLSVVSPSAATTEEVLFLANNYAVGGDVAVRVNMRTNGASRVFLEGGQWATGAGGQASIYVANTSGTLTQRMSINPDGLFTGTGTSLGAWTAYTPTISGTGWALGDGTMTALYCQIGKVVHVRIRVAWGTTSTFGTGALAFSVPLTVASVSSNLAIGGCRLFDTSATTEYFSNGCLAGNGTFQPKVNGTNGAGSNLTTSNPFTWANGDSLSITLAYETA